MFMPNAQSYLAVNYDAVGAGLVNIAGGSPYTFSHTASSGTYAVLTLYAGAFSGSPTTVTYGGISMSSLGSIALGSGSGLYMYGLANVPGGAQTISITTSGNVLLGMAQSVSYSNVVSVSAATTSSGTSTTPSIGPISCTRGQVVVCGLASSAGGTVNMKWPMGGINRYLAQATHTALEISDCAATMTFSATINSNGWGGIGVVLKPT